MKTLTGVFEKIEDLNSKYTIKYFTNIPQDLQTIKRKNLQTIDFQNGGPEVWTCQESC